MLEKAGQTWRKAVDTYRHCRWTADVLSCVDYHSHLRLAVITTRQSALSCCASACFRKGGRDKLVKDTAM